jgi:hypothetical protein
MPPRARENHDYAPDAKGRFETARQHSILHPEQIVGTFALLDYGGVAS